MKINGKIESLDEMLLFKAFYWLTADTLPSEAPTGKALDELSDFFTERPTCVLSAETTRIIYTKMNRAYNQLKKVTQEEKNKRGLTPARFELFRQTLADIKIAVDTKAKLDCADLSRWEPLKENEDWKTLLTRFKLAPLSDNFKGDLIAVKNKPKSDKLIFLFPDIHFNPKIQQAIRTDLLILNEKGLKLQGKEGWFGDLDFVKKYQDNPFDTVTTAYLNEEGEKQTTTVEIKRCIEQGALYLKAIDFLERPINAVFATECLLGDKIDSIGLEEAELNRKRQELGTKSPSKKPLERFAQHIENAEVNIQTEKRAVAILLEAMKTKRQKIAAMQFGLTHVREIVETLETAGVNYAIFRC